MVSRLRPALGAVFAVLAVAPLTACGSSRSSSSTTPVAATVATNAGSAPAGSTAVTVGNSPTAANVPLYYASSSGGFARSHLDVSRVPIISGAQAVPLLLSGQIQFTAADPVGALVAISKGIPLKIVATGQVVSPPGHPDTTGVIIKPASGITGAAGLTGKNVAVNARGGFAQIAAAAAIDRAGGDSSKVNWVVLPLPQMSSAVKDGTVDAAVENEPLVTAAEGAGLKVAFKPGSAAGMSGVPLLVYLASDSYIESHPAAVKAFQQDVSHANSYLAANPVVIRSIAARSTTTPPALLAKMSLPDFSPPTLSAAPINVLMQTLLKYKVLARPIPLSTAVYGALEDTAK